MAVRSRQGLGTLRAHTRPSGRRLFRSRQGLCLLPSAHTSVRTVAGDAWHLSLCCGSLRVVRALRRCLAPLRVPWLRPAVCLSGVPPGLAWCAAPRPVWSLPVLRSASPTPWFLSPPKGLAPPALLGGCAGHAEAGREPGSLCLQLAPAEAGALGSLGVAPVQGPRDGVVPGGSLRRRSWASCAAVVGVCGPGH